MQEIAFFVCETQKRYRLQGAGPLNKRRINEFSTKAAVGITMGRNKSIVTLKIFAVFVPPPCCS